MFATSIAARGGEVNIRPSGTVSVPASVTVASYSGRAVVVASGAHRRG
jgi:hypothetical protein